MHKITSLILQLAMVSGAIYFRVNTTRAEMLRTQEQISASAARALELLNQAREAMGGEDALKSIESLAVSGKSRRTSQGETGQTPERAREFKLYFMLPGKVMKATVELPPPPGGPAVAGQMMIRRAPAPGSFGTDRPQERGAPAPGKRVMRVRTDGPMAFGPYMMALNPVHFMLTSFLVAPSSLPIEYSYAGESTSQGSEADIIEAKQPGGIVVRIFLDKQTHLPLGMSYRTRFPPLPPGDVIMFKRRTDKEGGADRLIVPAPEAGHVEIPDVLITPPQNQGSEIEADGNSPEVFQIPLPPPQEVEVEVSFSDFRAVGGVLLPHRITQTFNGKETETWEVESFEINSPPPEFKKPGEKK